MYGEGGRGRESAPPRVPRADADERAAAAGFFFFITTYQMGVRGIGTTVTQQGLLPAPWANFEC
jgi:hypothetical protein